MLIRSVKTSMSIFFIICMVIAAFAGCATKTEPAKVKSILDGFNSTGYPIVDEPIVLTMMGSYNAGRSSALWEDNEFFTYMKNLTNVNFSFIQVDSSSYKEKFNTAIASGQLPDVFVGNGHSRQIITDQTKQGTFIRLNELIDQYAPNYKALLNKDVVRKNVTLPNGTISSFPFFQLTVEGTEDCPNELLTIYKPWLDKLKLEMPTDTDKFYNMLKAFKTQDPNGNGISDEIPLVTLNTSHIKSLFSMFGIMFDSNNLFVTDEGRVVYTPFTDEFMEGLKYFRKLYAEGLIDQACFTQNAQQVLAKGSQNTPIYGAAVASAAFAVVGTERAKEMEIAPIIKAPNGSQMWPNVEYCNPGAFIVTKNCKYPEVAVRWVDTFYSDEGSRYPWMGQENVQYTMNGDGTWQWVLKDGETSNDVRGRGTWQQTIGWVPSLNPNIWFKQIDETEGIANDQRTKLVKENPGKLRTASPKYFYESSISKTVYALIADLNSYFTQEFPKFIIGEYNLEGDWSNFVAKAKQMGVEELVKYVQDAYDQYLEL